MILYDDKAIGNADCGFRIAKLAAAECSPRFMGRNGESQRRKSGCARNCAARPVRSGSLRPDPTTFGTLNPSEHSKGTKTGMEEPGRRAEWRRREPASSGPIRPDPTTFVSVWGRGDCLPHPDPAPPGTIRLNPSLSGLIRLFFHENSSSLQMHDEPLSRTMGRLEAGITAPGGCRIRRKAGKRRVGGVNMFGF